MTLSELIEQLTMIAEQHPDHDPEVRIAYQPRWPLRASVANVRSLTDDEDEDAKPPVVWLAASNAAPWDESPYAPKSAWDEE